MNSGVKIIPGGYPAVGATSTHSPESGEERRGNNAHGAKRNPLRRRIADERRRRVDEQHAECRARDHGDQRRELHGQDRRGDLRLVTDFGQEEGDGSHGEHAAIGRGRGIGRVELVGLERPCGDNEERQRQCPAQDLGRDCVAYPVADPRGNGVVRDRGDEDARDDRPRLAESRGQHEC